VLPGFSAITKAHDDGMQYAMFNSIIMSSNIYKLSASYTVQQGVVTHLDYNCQQYIFQKQENTI